MLRRRKPTVDTVQDSWTMARAVDDGLPILVGVNAAYRDAVDREQYPVRVSVCLVVNEPNEQGWPSSAEGHQLQDAEDVILGTLRGRAVLVARVTGHGTREFTFYSRDQAWLPEFYADIVAAVGTHEVQMMTEPDPEWTVFHSLLPPQRGNSL